jgi:hypothetical protein
VTQLAVGQSTLEDCLAHLGSPLLVEEYGTGMVLYWGWGRERSWGLSVSVPVTENSSASASYDDVDLDLEALSISFDPGLRVEYLQYGRLADLLNAAARPRPQLVEDTAAEK